MRPHRRVLAYPRAVGTGARRFVWGGLLALAAGCACEPPPIAPTDAGDRDGPITRDAPRLDAPRIDAPPTYEPRDSGPPGIEPCRGATRRLTFDTLDTTTSLPH